METCTRMAGAVDWQPCSLYFVHSGERPYLQFDKAPTTRLGVWIFLYLLFCFELVLYYGCSLLESNRGSDAQQRLPIGHLHVHWLYWRAYHQRSWRSIVRYWQARSIPDVFGILVPGIYLHCLSGHVPSTLNMILAPKCKATEL